MAKYSNTPLLHHSNFLALLYSRAYGGKGFFFRLLRLRCPQSQVVLTGVFGYSETDLPLQVLFLS